MSDRINPKTDPGQTYDYECSQAFCDGRRRLRNVPVNLKDLAAPICEFHDDPLPKMERVWRKEDEYLPRGEIEAAITAGEISPDEILKAFADGCGWVDG